MDDQGENGGEYEGSPLVVAGAEKKTYRLRETVDFYRNNGGLSSQREIGALREKASTLKDRIGAYSSGLISEEKADELTEEISDTQAYLDAVSLPSPGALS